MEISHVYQPPFLLSPEPKHSLSSTNLSLFSIASDPHISLHYSNLLHNSLPTRDRYGLVVPKVSHVVNRPEFKEELSNTVKKALEEGARKWSDEFIKEFLQLIKNVSSEANNECRPSTNSSSPTPAKEAMPPSSAIGTNDLVSIKGTKSMCNNNLQLMFLDDVESPVFTNRNLLKRKIRFQLINNKTGCLVSVGPEASAELEVGLLDGRYKKQKELGREHIVINQLKPREKKSQYLLKGGNNHLTLENGVGEFPTSLTITDTSRMVPTFNGTFCFSLVPSDPESSIQGVTSNEFIVKDERGKGSQKHHPPQGDSEVWRLDRISKKGEYCRKLENMDIRFVSELHARFEDNREDFQKIFNNDFDQIESHLMEYKPDASNHMETVLKNQCMGSYIGFLDQTTINHQEIPTSNQGSRLVEQFGLNDLSRFTQSIPMIQTNAKVFERLLESSLSSVCCQSYYVACVINDQILKMSLGLPKL